MKLVKTIAVLAIATCITAPVIGFAATKNNALSATATQTASSSTININTADDAALQSVVGLGPAKAKAIVRYREQHGNFKSIEDLTNVQGIGPKLFEKIKNQITV